MPLLTGNRVRQEGAGHIVEATWERRCNGFTHELPHHQRQKLLTAAGRRQLDRFPGLAANLTPAELATVARIFGAAIERSRNTQRAAGAI